MSARRLRPIFFAAIVLAVALAAPSAAPTTAQPPPAALGFAAPGGIAAMPSALPGQPFLYDQGFPAITSADPLRGRALVGVFCDPASPCPNDPSLGVPSVSFVAEPARWWGGARSLGATFEYTGTSALVCGDGAPCDLTGATDGSVVVALKGGGKDEAVRVTAWDLSGDERMVTVIFVQTMFAFPPVTPSASSAPALVSYACHDVGLAPMSALTGTSVTLGELWNTQGPYGGPIGASVPWDYGPLYSCGGDTPSTGDDGVQFETGLGALSVLDPAGTASSLCSSQGVCNAALSSYPPFVPTLEAGCDAGKSVAVLDSPANAATSAAQLCDLDHAPNGVVTYGVVGGGDVGQSTITGEQSGNPSSWMKTYVYFVGPPHWLYFYPDPQIANSNDNPFTVVVLDQGLMSVADEAVECHTSPPSAPFAAIPPTATSGSWSNPTGMATFDPGLVAVTTHIIGGEEFDLTCFVQSDPSVSITATVTVPLWWDADGDGVPGSEDNCPFVYNPGQENTDVAIDNGPGVPGDDTTVPNAVADSEGDACESDGDADNDGLPDASEDPLAGCGPFNGTPPGHPNPAGGDVTNDDNHNGDPAPPMGTDAADNGPSWDTDNDGVWDGVECTLGHNPRIRTDRPSTADCGGSGDTDGDGLQNAWETCGWGTSPTVVDTDGDTRGDCKEAADVDGNGLVNFVGDTMYYAQAILLPPAAFGRTMDFDIDKNGLGDFVGDVMLEAQFALIDGLCK